MEDRRPECELLLVGHIKGGTGLRFSCSEPFLQVRDSAQREGSAKSTVCWSIHGTSSEKQSQGMCID